MAGTAGSTGLAKVMMPVPDPHPDVFDSAVAAAGRRHRPRGPAAVRRRHPPHPGHRLGPAARDGLRGNPSAVDRPAHDDRPDRARSSSRTCCGCVAGARARRTGGARCASASTGRKGGLIESEAFWININRETQGPARIADDFLEGLQRTTDVDRLRWKAYLKAGSREDAAEIREYPVRVSDIDIFDHMNNSVYWSVIEDYLLQHTRTAAQRRCG